MRLFMWIDDPTRWGVTFWTQEFGIENSKLFVFIKIRLSQPREHYCVQKA